MPIFYQTFHPNKCGAVQIVIMYYNVKKKVYITKLTGDFFFYYKKKEYKNT